MTNVLHTTGLTCALLTAGLSIATNAAASCPDSADTCSWVNTGTAATSISIPLGGSEVVWFSGASGGRTGFWAGPEMPNVPGTNSPWFYYAASNPPVEQYSIGAPYNYNECIWQTSTNNEIMFSAASANTKFDTGLAGTSLASGPNCSLWAVGTDGNLHYYDTAGKWTQMNLPVQLRLVGTPPRMHQSWVPASPAKQISVSPDGTGAWLIAGANDGVYYAPIPSAGGAITSLSWTAVAGPATSITASNGASACIAGADGNEYCGTSSTSNWNQVGPLPAGTTEIAQQWWAPSPSQGITGMYAVANGTIWYQTLGYYVPQ